MKPWPYAVAAITGASSGIGRELALEIARRGSDVALLARRREALEETAASVEGLGRKAVALPCDVRDRAAVLAAIAEAASRLGPIDLLVANAGIGVPLSASRWDGSRVAETFEVNVLGAAHAFEAVLPGMLERGRGHLVGVSSLAAWRGVPGHGPYGASKAAMNVMLESLRAELAPRGVAVTTICPGFVRTPMTARNKFRMPFLMEPEEAARRIARAIAARRRVYAFPWPFSWIVRAAAHLPAAIGDRLLG